MAIYKKNWKYVNPLCRRCLNGNATVEHLLCECESLTISRGQHFWAKFWSASTTLAFPSGSISTVCRRNRTSWEIIDGGAQLILIGRSALGSNDHPINVMYCIDGVVIAVQCTATFSDPLCSPIYYFPASPISAANRRNRSTGTCESCWSSPKLCPKMRPSADIVRDSDSQDNLKLLKCFNESFSTRIVAF